MTGLVMAVFSNGQNCSLSQVPCSDCALPWQGCRLPLDRWLGSHDGYFVCGGSEGSRNGGESLESC